ncbi:MAG: hypothetical protein AUH11_09580 [Acidobacteria bacterium 13_2_20CM_57_17]|nr:MAG: hypothetical protein AUH11_09580 [Acidobacteria bacterium 13_2_20CM_57_17]OLB94879.1 MAG: hypothetical protein AUI02_04480 [Acidobacteria bacterium 13_2_20CM_2_57_12]
MGWSANEIDHRDMKTVISTFNVRVPGHLFVRAEFRETMGHPIRRYIVGGNSKHSGARSYRLKTWRCDLVVGISEY